MLLRHVLALSFDLAGMTWTCVFSFYFPLFLCLAGGSILQGKEALYRPRRRLADANRLDAGRRLSRQALFLQPKLLMLDEPTNHLDLDAVLLPVSQGVP